ncbi:AAA domain-containing protein, partial [Haematococcus lacustris]
PLASPAGCCWVAQAAWPEAFQQPLKELAAGRKVAVPRPHPKFSMQDMERIATQGPVFSDIMLRHVERDSPESASAYNYVPSTVLGDWTYEVEPNWVNLPQLASGSKLGNEVCRSEDCPGEHQIQLSWHWGQDHVQHPLQQFLVACCCLP